MAVNFTEKRFHDIIVSSTEKWGNDKNESEDSKSGGEADRILSGTAGGAAAFFIYYGKNGFGSKNRRSIRDTSKYQSGYQGDTVAGGSSGHRNREEGLCGQ